MHRMLERQIEKFLPNELRESLGEFLASVDAIYTQYEADGTAIQNAMYQMSLELVQRNQELERVLAEKQKRKEDLLQSLSELREINSKLEATQNQLLQADKMASIGQLAAGVAHEINNPIGYIFSNLSTLERYLQDLMKLLAMYELADPHIHDEKLCCALLACKEEIDLAYLRTDIEDLMNESKEGVSRVRKIVQDLKDFSHVDEAEWMWTDLRNGLTSTLNIVHNEIKTKAELILNYGDMPEVQCIASQINQVFMNLLVNASHAIESRGTITISTGHTNSEVWIKISDTGSGIKKEHLPRIFDAFFTTKAVGKGTGLGLSLSYSIIKKHSGRLEVESEIGKGTAFTIWLPISQPNHSPANDRQRHVTERYAGS